MGTAEAAIAPAPRTTPAIRWLLSAIAAALALALVLGGAYTLLDLAALAGRVTGELYRVPRTPASAR